MGMEMVKERLLESIGDDPAAARTFSEGLHRFESYLLREMPHNPKALDAAMSLTATLASALEEERRQMIEV